MPVSWDRLTPCLGSGLCSLSHLRSLVPRHRALHLLHPPVYPRPDSSGLAHALTLAGLAQPSFSSQALPEPRRALIGLLWLSENPCPLSQELGAWWGPYLTAVKFTVTWSLAHSRYTMNICYIKVRVALNLSRGLDLSPTLLSQLCDPSCEV